MKRTTKYEIKNLPKNFSCQSYTLGWVWRDQRPSKMTSYLASSQAQHGSTRGAEASGLSSSQMVYVSPPSSMYQMSFRSTTMARSWDFFLYFSRDCRRGTFQILCRNESSGLLFFLLRSAFYNCDSTLQKRLKIFPSPAEMSLTKLSLEPAII
jgi:hypothetical protein